jgi:hypothetical protein
MKDLGEKTLNYKNDQTFQLSNKLNNLHIGHMQSVDHSTCESFEENANFKHL